MPTYRVTAPSGRKYKITAPEGATAQQVIAIAQRHDSAQKSGAVAAGGPRATQAKIFAGLAQGLANVGDHAADKLEGAYNSTLGNLFGKSSSADTPAFSNAAAKLGRGSPAAKTAGEIVGTALLTRGLPGGAFAQGAASSGLMSDSKDALGIATDAAIGGAGGYLTNKAVGAANSLIAPKVSDAARYLHKRGVRMTPGQAVPSLQRGEEKLMSRPFIGDKITAGRQQSYADFNRVAVEDTLAPAGLKLPEKLQGRAAVKWAGDNVSREYDDLIPKLTFRADDQFVDDVLSVHSRVHNGDMTPKAVAQFNRIVENQIMPRLAGGAPLTGQQYRNIEKGLSAQIARYGKSTDPDHQAMAEAFKEMQGAFQAGLQRSNLPHAEKLAGLNESWANLVRVEGASSGARMGMFSPGQFWNAVKSADKTTRHRGVARGEALMQELADAAVDVLPSDYPDSGTAGRSQMNFMDPRYWYGAGQSLFYGPEVQKFITNAAMAPRPPAAETVANLLGYFPAPQAGAAAASQLGPSR